MSIFLVSLLENFALPYAVVRTPLLYFHVPVTEQNGQRQWFLTFFYISYPFCQTRLPDLPPVHSMVVYLLIYWKYEINKFLQFRIIH